MTTDTPAEPNRSGPPELGVDATLAYWTEERRRAARPVQPPDPQRAEQPAGRIDRTATPAAIDGQPGPDPVADPARTQARAIATALVAHPDQYPHRTVGKLFFRVGDLDYVGSAAVVTQAGILTAAHCVRDPHTNRWSSHIAFAPGYDNGVNPHYGIWPVGEMATDRQWPADVGYDFAFCRVPAINGTQIGDLLGWLGILVNRPEIGYWDDHGYPAQPIPGFAFNGQAMWNCGGGRTQTVGSTVRKEGNLTPGASGGPWIVRSDDGQFYANGTLSMVFNNPPTENSTPYFRDAVTDLYHAVFG